MKRWSLILFRFVIALAIVFAGAGVLNPGNTAQAGIANPDGLRSGSLAAAWRWVDTLGHTGSPYPQDIQGDRLYRPAGIFIDAGGRLFLTEESGKRLWGFADVDFTDPIQTPAASGVNDPFWNPRDVTRSHDLTWVMDSHHLVVLDNAGTIVQNFYNFDVTDPALGWVQNYFQCANSLSFDDLTGLLYVAQNCGDNPVLVLRVETPAIYFPTSLTLVDAFNLGKWEKNHIQTADLNEDASSEVYVSSDNGTFQCEQPAAMPGNWSCSPYAQGSLHRTRGLTYSADEHELYALDQVDWDWNQNSVRKCLYDGSCETIVSNNDLNNTPNLTLNDPIDLALAASGDFYITDSARSVVAKLSFTAGLSFVPVFGVLDEAYITAEGYLNNPSSVVTDAEDNLYVAENSGRRVLSFDAAGAPRWEWGIPGSWTGNQSAEICNPQGNMAFDPTGNLYVADRCSGRIVILDKDDGTYLSSFSANSGKNNPYGFNGPSGVAISPSGRMFVSDPDNHRVQEYRYYPYVGWIYFSTIGIPLTWPDPSTGDGALMDPSGLALNGDNEIFVADQNYNRVQKCARTAATSSVWSCANLVGLPNVGGNSNYLLSSPQGLALDADGRLYVADNNNQRIQVYDSQDGTHLGAIATGDNGAENDRLANPYGVTLDSAGNVYVADSNNHRVQKFHPTVPALEYVNQQGGQSYVSYRSGNLLFTGYGNRLYVYDLSADPAQPLKIGQSQAFAGTVQDVVVTGNYAYVASSGGGLVVLDISTPSAPVYLRELLVTGDGQALALDETAGSLYVLQNGPTALLKYSLADPAEPVFDSMHWINAWAGDVVVGSNVAYVSVSNGPSWITALDALDLGGTGETKILDTVQAAQMALDGTTLYAADPGFGLYQIDTTGADPLNSLAMASGPRSIHLLGDYGFADTTNYGAYAAVHISGASLTLAGEFTIDQWRATGNTLEVGWDTGGEPLIYVPGTKGLSTYQVDTAVSPLGFALSSQETPDYSTGWGGQAQLIGNTLYLNDLGSFKIFDNTNPTAPVLINTLTHPDTGVTPFFVREIGAQRILYILAWEDYKLGIQPEFRSYDITNPANLIPLELTPPKLQRGNLTLAVAVVGAKLVAAVSEIGYWDGSVSPNEWHPGWLEMFDLTDPAAIAALPGIETFNGNVTDLAIQGHYLFASEMNRQEQAPDGQWNNGGGGGLHVFDFSAALNPVSPTAPEEKAVFGTGDAQAVEILGDTVFATDRWQGLFTLTIDAGLDPSAWTHQSVYRFPGSTMDIKVTDLDGKATAWVVNDNWLRILDVTNPSPGEVKEIDSVRLPFNPDGAALSLNLPWLWTVFWNNGYSAWWAAPTMDGTVSTPAATLTSSLDGVSYTFANENLRLWHTPVFQGNLPPAPQGLAGINRAFVSSVFDPQTELPVSLSGPYTLTVSYNPAQLGKVTESSLKLYFWDGTTWVAEPSTLNTSSHTLTAHPNHFSAWSVMGPEQSFVFLPGVTR